LTRQHQKSSQGNDTHQGPDRLAIQFSFELYDEAWNYAINIFTQTIPLDIGTLKGSPLFHLDEEVFVFSCHKRKANPRGLPGTPRWHISRILPLVITGDWQLFWNGKLGRTLKEPLMNTIFFSQNAFQTGSTTTF
jgi:hypothetical protein